MAQESTIDQELLKDEYLKLFELVDSFDNKGLTIKAWSVTISMAGIGMAFISHSPILLLFASLSAIIFWVLEAYWKTFQMPYLVRIDEIEAYYSGKLDTISLFQISRVWKETYNRKDIYQTMKWLNLMIPHVVITLIGIILFVLDGLSLISV